ncbi:MAG: S-layer homology domain-containing protein [Candidatus Obscuribacter sp.]|jgi:hypothetical protein|nr:S-layer homology domain-containing protein [Candidatus Obscuribacter sp.]MBK7839005.1 S-layer homology domain-containing protein [Candidatus Obscuribacter sp.]MBK9771693.1 S-layer homology domain-containing protein [Candidatus Obscuribacter sp.]MDQ5967728.1 S-layer y protein [Cyanobacteriota bacterium erpe_2018_sw_39hr_WHONDRS-SW48-000098_B_bin.30]
MTRTNLKLSSRLPVWCFNTSLVLSLAFTLTLTNPAYAARFTDLSGNFAEKYINTLSDDGVIAAEPDGKFHPSDPVTRAQLADWMVKAMGLQNQSVPSTPSFTDVKPSDWFYKSVEIIKQNNYIAGYPDGFRPKQNIQRGEMISIIARGLNSPTPDSGSIARALSRFGDKNKIPDWARPGIAQAELAGMLTSNEASNVNATGIATRAETAAILARFYDVKGDQAVRQAISNPGQAAGNQMATATRTPSLDYQNQTQGYQPTGYPSQPALQTNPYQVAQNYNQGNYQGQVQMQGGQPQYPPPNNYPNPGQPESFNAQPPPQFYQQTPYQQPPQSLSGRVAVVGAGTQFQATLRNSLDSGSTQVGEPVEATLSSPLYANGQEVVPAGSKVTGSVTNVISARRFRFGANGKIDIKFNSVETPDGRRFPLSASVNGSEIRLTGGTTAGRVGKGLLTTGIGAGGGAALGTGLGAIVGAMSHGQVGRATGMGAVFGTAIGGGVGLVGAGVRKGSEVIIKSGTPLPVQLDESMQVTTGGPSYGGGYPPQGGGYAPQGGGYPPQGQYQQPQYQQPQYPPQGGGYPPQGGNNNNPYGQ